MGIFDTNANTYANGFYGPQNGAFNNPGWGADPNFMTPAYSAPYRPGFNGSNPYVPYGSPGFFGGLGNVVSPFGHVPISSNYGTALNPSIDAVSQRPMDAFMTGMQRYAIPGAAMWGLNKWLGPNTGSILGDTIGTFTGRGIGGAFGKGVGSRMFGHAATGIGMGARGVGAFSSVGGFVGSAVGSLALPILGAQAISSVANATMIDPYMQQRQASADLRRNFAGVTFGDAQGDYLRGGRGLSRTESGRMAADITRAGIQDHVFDRDQYTAIADMAGRSGLLDNTNSQNLTKKIKSIADQVKLVMQISQDPSVQGAIEQLSKLQLAGAGTAGGRFSVAASAYTQLGLSASAAGTSVQALMARVGGQGQMLYGMNGMTPYMGQVAAGNLYSGFASGYRTGLLSDALMARMGGMEGATQSALTGAVNALQTPFARMAMYNQYFGGHGTGGSVAHQVGLFGQMMGDNPLKGLGNQMLYGNQMASRYFSENGLGGVEKMGIQFLEASGQRRGANGKFDAAQLAVALSGMGMSPDQIQAVIAQRASETDGNSVNQRARGYAAQTKEMLLSTIENEHLSGTVFGKAGYYASSISKGVSEGIADKTGIPLSQITDRIGDSWSRFTQWWQVGDTLGQSKGVSADALFGDVSGGKLSIEGFDLDKIKGGNNRGLAEAIQKMAMDSGNPGSALARQFLSTKDPAKRKSLLAKLTRDFKDSFREGAYDDLFGSGYSSGSGSRLNTFLSDIQGVQNKMIKADGTEAAGFGKSLDKVLGDNAFSMYDDMRMIGNVGNLVEKFGKGDLNVGNIDEIIAADPELKKLFGNRRGDAAMEYLTDMGNRMVSEGHAGKGMIARELGSLDANIKNDGANIKDPALRAKFQAAKKTGNRSAMEKILSEYVIRSMGGSTSEASISTRRMNLSQIGMLSKDLVASAKANMANSTNSMGADVDYKGHLDKVNSLDAPVGRFNAGVSAFVTAVDAFVGSRGMMPGYTGPNTATNRGQY